MVIYRAKVVGLNSHIEEEVTLEVNDIEVTCFAGICPYEIDVGQEYPVTFSMLDFEVSEQEQNMAETSLRRIGNSYSYQLKGKLMGDVIQSSINVSDEFLTEDYAYLIEKYITVLVERLDVEFLYFY